MERLLRGRLSSGPQCGSVALSSCRLSVDGHYRCHPRVSIPVILPLIFQQYRCHLSLISQQSVSLSSCRLPIDGQYRCHPLTYQSTVSIAVILSLINGRPVWLSSISRRSVSLSSCSLSVDSQYRCHPVTYQSTASIAVIYQSTASIAVIL